ncbi:MAG: glutamine--fructose-6-phosphate transaminase (isomerizing) [Geminicoccaceae bacterium]|nr:MAG: glutamine--fructose-6-phosphate transaminase (isomerizing) [Geminicoccaceae bacterium]
MCGIVGLLGRQLAAPLLLEGLRRLEYRGYDSAGIATLERGRLDRRRAEGKIANLEAVLAARPLAGTVGIGHTRWATHGQPNETNAHPHIAEGVAVVHNGIIENFQELRDRLEAEGHRFDTETDTEVIPHLIGRYRRQGLDAVAAVAATLGELHGAYALALMTEDVPDCLVVARKGSPLAIGYGNGEMYVGSDAMALAPLTDRIQYLEEGDWAVIDFDGAVIRNEDGEVVERPIVRTAYSGALIGKGNHRHFMEKEIYEQPAVLGDTLTAFQVGQARLAIPDLPFDFATLQRLHVIGCGTASLAGLTAKYWFERLAALPVDWDIASEFRYREPPLIPGAGAIFISQSGETADTLAALRLVRQAGLATLALVNVPESSIAREAHGLLRTLAGPEIGVASTKAFTTQLASLACLALIAGEERGTLTPETVTRLLTALEAVPAQVLETLELAEPIRHIAEALKDVRDVLFIGRGTAFPIALEGALKLKELTYVHAEGYAAGELKHGPIALVDEHTPVIVVAPPDHVFEKTASNLQEVVARGGRVLLLSDAAGVNALERYVWRAITLPDVDPFTAPIVYSVPLQLLAYHVAVWRGTDVDQPRNLAKSVTVE